MFRKILKTFKSFTTPSEGSYPIVDRLLGLTPLIAGIAFSWSQNNQADYKPLEKAYSYSGLPIVLGTYVMTQLGLTYGKDKVEQIENPKLKAVADFTVGLLDTWNNVPLYAYASNMFPKQYSVNFAVAFKCLPKIVETVESDIRTTWKGSNDYKLTAWETIAPTLIGLAAKNASEGISAGYKEQKQVGTNTVSVDTIDSVLVDSMVSSSIEQVLTGLLNPKKYESGKFESTLMKNFAQNVCYSRGEFLKTSELLGKFGEAGAIFNEQSALGGALPEIMLVETLFYLLSKADPLFDYIGDGMRSLCDDNPELCQEATFPLLEKSAAAA